MTPSTRHMGTDAATGALEFLPKNFEGGATLDADVTIAAPNVLPARLPQSAAKAAPKPSAATDAAVQETQRTPKPGRTVVLIYASLDLFRLQATVLIVAATLATISSIWFSLIMNGGVNSMQSPDSRSMMPSSWKECSSAL